MTTTTVTSPLFEVVSRHEFGDVLLNTSTNQKSLHATIAIKPGDVLSKFHAGVTQSFATYLTVQTGVDKHITLQPEFLQYINHSCNPNVLFNTDTMQLECLQNIKAGDELCFFYPATEWNMAQPFDCLCGSKSCIGKIQGAKYVSEEVLNNYKLTSFIQLMLNNKKD